MILKTFKGGIHPDDKKEHTRYLKIEDLPAPKTMIFPLSQHIGAPSEPVVKLGENVKVGQLIAKASGFVSANLHCSVSGTVFAIEPRMHPNGSLVNSIIIENDDNYEISESVQPNKPLNDLTPQEIIKIIEGAGIVGMGGAAFPTHVKLSPPKDKKIDFLIINGSECEPYLTSDHRVMLENPEGVLFGCKAIMKALGVTTGFVAVESNKDDAIKTLIENAKDYTGIEVVQVETKYPQGSEKQLIDAVTGRKVPPGGLPADIGVVVVNIDTCAATSNAIKTGMPLIKRIVTVGGGAINEFRNFRVRIGTPAKDVIDAVGGFKTEPAKILFGGPMMGTAIFSLDIPIIKGTGAILALTDKEINIGTSGPCLRCGKCVDICPMNLQPLMLNMLAKKGDLEGLERYNVMDCIECGACSYICPGRQNLIQYIRTAKQQIIASKKKGE